MKRFIAVILIIVFSSIFALAQNENWKTFAPSGDEFSIETPVSLKKSRITKNAPEMFYEGSLNGTYYYVISDSLKDLHYFKEVKKFLFLSKKGSVSKKIGEFETEKYELNENDDFYHTVLTVKTKNHLYTFQTLSPSRKNPAVERFFSSIKLSKKSLGEIAVWSEADSTKNQTTTSGNEVSSVSTGNTDGNRPINEDRTGDGIGTGNSSKDSTTTKSLMLMSKPRANYTDFARFYGIQGTVTLRVTFLANGQIGAVTPATKLPFGLTTQAIAAAKGIRFEPAMKDGVAYSVTKIVQYTFTIY